MPAASPLPRAPSVLTLSSAADLLTERGCPVCRYAAEAADRYLVWFALEAHADSVMITRLGVSLGAAGRADPPASGVPGMRPRSGSCYTSAGHPARRAGGAGSSSAVPRCGRSVRSACPCCRAGAAAAPCRGLAGTGHDRQPARFSPAARGPGGRPGPRRGRARPAARPAPAAGARAICRGVPGLRSGRLPGTRPAHAPGPGRQPGMGERVPVPAPSARRRTHGTG